LVFIELDKKDNETLLKRQLLFENITILCHSVNIGISLPRERYSESIAVKSRNKISYVINKVGAGGWNSWLYA